MSSFVLYHKAAFYRLHDSTTPAWKSSFPCLCLSCSVPHQAYLELNLPLPFLMMEANNHDGFPIILRIISPAQLNYAAVLELGQET
jgi:hypothetical protein